MVSGTQPVLRSKLPTTEVVGFLPRWGFAHASFAVEGPASFYRPRLGRGLSGPPSTVAVDCPAGFILCGLALYPQAGNGSQTRLRSSFHSSGVGLLSARTDRHLWQASTTMTHALNHCKHTDSKPPAGQSTVVGGTERARFLPPVNGWGSALYHADPPAHSSVSRARSARGAPAGAVARRVHRSESTPTVVDRGRSTRCVCARARLKYDSSCSQQRATAADEDSALRVTTSKCWRSIWRIVECRPEH